MAKHAIRDLYGEAQFRSAWQVVVHATPGDSTKVQRLQLLEVAERSFAKNHRWRAYRMVFATTKNGTRLHIGYRYANPKDWFFIPEAGFLFDADGPFDTKNIIKRKLGLKTTSKRAPGIYDAKLPEGGSVTLFTRDKAEVLFSNPKAGEELP